MPFDKHEPSPIIYKTVHENDASKIYVTKPQNYPAQRKINSHIPCVCTKH